MPKPPKKSDLDKSWMPTRRDRKIPIAPEYHLIVTEGTKTEPNYFKGLIAEIDKKYPPGRIKIEGLGRNTLSLLEYAERLVKNKYNLLEIKHIWLVYDKDDFPADNFDNTFHKCADISKNSDRKYHALWSNECIELWFLLHFEYLQAALSRDDYYPKLTVHLQGCGKYEKNRDDIYNILKPRMSEAVRNAKKLNESYGSAPPSKCSPGTKVHEIFEYLGSYLK